MRGAAAFACLVLTLLTGCSSEGEGEGDGGNGDSGGSSGSGSGGKSSGGGGAGTSGSAGTPAGGSSGAPGSGFDHCGESAPNSTCTKELTCAQLGCGQLESRLDADGCMRQSCTSDADCAADELCFPAPAVYQVDAAFPRFDPTCTVSGQACQCTGKTVSQGAEAHCGPKTEVFGGWGCSFSTYVTDDCELFATWLSDAQAFLDGLTLEATVETQARACITQAQEQYDESCP